MTRQRTWTARPARRRIRRRHATARILVVIGLGIVAATVITVAVTSLRSSGSAPGAAAETASPVAPLVVAVPASPTASEPSPSGRATATASEDASAPPATEVVVRVPTQADPLRVWIAGDSMWEAAGPVVAARLEATGVVATWLDVRHSSGLTRPDFFDWSDRAAGMLQDVDPELVLMLVGANDAQTVVTDGVRHAFGTDGFQQAYQQRTRQLMDRLTAGGRHLVWVGLPVMRPAGYDARMQVVTDVHRDVAATVPGATFVPTRALFSGADGAYAHSLTDAAGQLQQLRGADGIHLTHAGAERLADHLVDRIQEIWNLPVATPETSP